MLWRVNTSTAPPEEMMIKQGDDADFLYLISKGEVEISVTDQSNDEEAVNRLWEGDLYGEVALLHNIKRTASVSCLNYCTFATFTGDDFKEVCRAFPLFNREIRKKKNQYKDKWKDFCRTCIMHVEYLKNLPSTIIEEIIYMLKLENHDLGEVIQPKGEEVTKLRMIADGKIEISILCDNGQNLILDTLSTGSNIFAFSLLGLASTIFDVKAKTPVTVLSINLNDLRSYWDMIPALNTRLKETEQYIGKFGVPIIDW